MPGLDELPELRWTDRNPNKWATVLIYAQARWGKTDLFRTCPTPIVLATEIGNTKGLQTLADMHIPFIPIRSADMLTVVLTELNRVKGQVQYKGEGPFMTVGVDSLTGLGELWYERSLDIRGWEMAWDGTGQTGSKDPRNAYPYVAEKGRQHMKLLMALEANLLCLCREGIQEEGQGKERIVFSAPELPGQKLPRELPGWPDATLYGVWVNRKRVLRTQTLGKTVAGFRVPRSFEVPFEIGIDMEAVFRLTRGDKTALDKLKATPGR